MEPTIKNTLVTALHAWDGARPRSTQVEIGPSSLGSCRRKVWMELQGAEVTNPHTLRLPAIMGTAIHSVIEQAFRVNEDPWRYELEVEVTFDGMTGHVDLYDTETKTVWDWKTITKRGVDYFPGKERWWQTMVYGYLLSRTGKPVDWVGMVAVVRDGNEADVVEVVRPYDEGVALEALAWLADVRGREVAPDPEKDAVSFCNLYCGFYDNGEATGGCPGKKRQAKAPLGVLGDEEASLVAAFVAARAEADEADKRVAAAREALTGVTGQTPDGWAVTWSERQGSTVDRDAIKAALGDVPMKPGKTSMVLTVKGAS